VYETPGPHPVTRRRPVSSTSTRRAPASRSVQIPAVSGFHRQALAQPGCGAPVALPQLALPPRSAVRAQGQPGPRSLRTPRAGGTPRASGVRALRRRKDEHPGPLSAPSVATAPGRPLRVEHEYPRAGAWTYLAAWDVHRARVFGRCEAKTGIAPLRPLGGLCSRTRQEDRPGVGHPDRHLLPVGELDVYPYEDL
jgi:hypothetical protein